MRKRRIENDLLKETVHWRTRSSFGPRSSSGRVQIGGRRDLLRGIDQGWFRPSFVSSVGCPPVLLRRTRQGGPEDGTVQVRLRGGGCAKLRGSLPSLHIRSLEIGLILGGR